MIIFFAIGTRERAKELVRIITKTRWKTISKNAIKIASSSIGPTVVIFKPSKAGLATALWLKKKAEELQMTAVVGWLQEITSVPDDVLEAINNDLKRRYMAKLAEPWAPFGTQGIS
ncbi:MAG: hypothetical protein NO126_00660 [Sulfolobales archaeon]|nr:hypothetical protein [Sulfolobales archaeon]